MKNPIVIGGGQMTGKTTLAKILAHNKRSYFTDTLEFHWEHVPHWCEVLVIDGLSSPEELRKIKILAKQTTYSTSSVYISAHRDISKIQLIAIFDKEIPNHIPNGIKIFNLCLR